MEDLNFELGCLQWQHDSVSTWIPSFAFSELGGCCYGKSPEDKMLNSCELAEYHCVYWNSHNLHYRRIWPSVFSWSPLTNQHIASIRGSSLWRSHLHPCSLSGRSYSCFFMISVAVPMLRRGHCHLGNKFCRLKLHNRNSGIGGSCLGRGCVCMGGGICKAVQLARVGKCTI